MGEQVRLHIRPVSLKDANAFVAELHRHHKPVPGHKFSIGVHDGEQLRGVAIIGRPVARMLDNGMTLEVNRVCTDGCPNACSALYGAARRIAKEMGYARLITYTLPEEGGVSLRASGWVCEGEAGGGNWNVPSRPRDDSPLPQVKWRWSATLGGSHAPR